MAAVIVGAADHQAANARGAHFCEGDFLTDYICAIVMNINDGSDAERENLLLTSASVAWAGQFEGGRQGAAQISARWAAPSGAVCFGETLRARGTAPSRITRGGAVLGHA